jgi:uncharacterized membrane protein
VVVVEVGTVPPAGHCAVVAACVPVTGAETTDQVDPLACVPHAASVAAVQAGVPLVVVVTGAPDAVCVPLVQV